MACPGDHTLHLFLDGKLGGGDRGGVQSHLDGCESCRQVLMAFGQGSPPEQIDEYRLVRRLGAGAMGEVHLAHDTKLDRPVAIKFLTRPGEEGTARLMREARAVAQLQHPNVADIFRVGERDGTPYLVTEFVDGGTLADAPRPMAPAQVVAIGIALGRGLAAAHAKGVLHRDIKLHNVMLAKDGTVKLVDFGLARAEVDPTAAASPSADAGLTRSGALVGTPRYLAPELWNAQAATPQSDLYAFGTVLYELLAGVPPHAAATLDALRRAVLAEDPRRLTGVPRALAAVVDRCLKRDPAQRFASAAEAVAALERLQRPARARWVPLAVAAGAALAVVAFRGSTTPGARLLTEAQRQWKDGSSVPALRTLARAVEAEPTSGAAWLWSAFVEPDPALARAHFGQALLYRDGLDADDAALLDALEPGQVPTPDLAAWLAVVDAQRSKRPDALLLRLVRARVLAARRDGDAAVAELEAAARADPSLAVQADVQAALVDRHRARAEPALARYAQCLARSKRATDCLAGKVRLEGLAGQCAQMETDARFWSSVDPQDDRAFDALANALFAVRAPWPSIEEAMRARAAVSKAEGPRLAREAELAMATARGELAQARTLALAALDAVPPGAGLQPHLEAAYTVVLIAQEMGDRETVVRVSKDFLARARARTAETHHQVATTMLFAHALMREGAMTPAEFEAARRAYIKDPAPTIATWGLSYAMTTTREGAIEALAHQPEYGPLPTPGTYNSAGELMIGAVLARAGRYRESLTYLSRVTGVCYQLENPIAWVRGLYLYGEALAETGDPAGARAAWQKAVDLYGKSPSVHAAKSAERLAALR